MHLSRPILTARSSIARPGQRSSNRHSATATLYVYAERDGAITGVLPLAQVKTLLFGNTLISVPFCVYGGPLAVDPETAAALSGHAASLLERTGAGAVEFRYRGQVAGYRLAGRAAATSAAGETSWPAILPARRREKWPGRARP